MKRKRIITLYLLAGCILFASPSCSREEMDFLPQKKNRIPVSLSLSVTEMNAGTPETKAVMEPDVDSPSLEQQVKNFVVLQFEGSGKDAKLVALPEYYSDADKVFNGEEQVRLLPTSKPSVIAVVANTFDNIVARSGMTLEQFLQMDYSRMADYNSVFTRDDGNDYIRMSGINQIQGIDADTPVAISLKRNISKITIHVKNETAGVDKVTLSHVQLRDINGKYYYLTNVDAFEDAYSPLDPCRLDKDPEEWPAGESEQSFTYYIPANLRGETNSPGQYSKGLGAPEGATRFCLYGTYGSNNTAINYTYYLGKNLTDNFDLKPNYHYTYNITLKSKGDARYDYRIEDCKEVKFLVDANCYMVQPPYGIDQERIYAIPVRRAAVFWNSQTDGYNGVYGARNISNYTNFKFNNGSRWSTEVLWSDFELNPADFLAEATGEGFPLTGQQDAYFKIRVRSGMKGNAVVAVKVGTAIVWSWHIWITDYNPDREALTPTPGTYVYGVDHGQIHRYDNDFFNEGEYSDHGFIMDRNLGASEASDRGMKGTMYYQFGRKDPFMVYNQKGEFNTYYTYPKGHIQKMTDFPIVKKGETGSENVLYTILNPGLFIVPDKEEEIWSEGDALVGLTNIWHDKKIEDHTELAILEKNKSIYDPCPPGWKVPGKAAFNLASSNTSPTTDGGLLYTPTTGAAIYFPGHRFLNWDGRFSRLNRANRLSDIWSAEPTKTGSKKNTAYSFSFNSSSPRLSEFSKSYGFSVRCMRDSEYKRENYIAD